MMHRVMRLLLALALLACPATARDRLDPVPPQDAVSRTYDATFRAVFREAYQPGVEVRVIVTPSWALDYAIGLRRGASGHEIFLIEPSIRASRYASIELEREGHYVSPSETREQVLRRLDEERRHLPPSLSDVPISRCSAPIDERTAAAVIAAWRNRLQNIGPQPDSFTFDGVNYRFSMELGGRLVEGQQQRGGVMPQLADAMGAYCSKSRGGSRIALWAGAFLAALSIVPAILLLGWGFQRITGRRVPTIDRLGSAFRRRGFARTWAIVSIVLVSLLVYAAFAVGNSREVLRAAEVIASAG